MSECRERQESEGAEAALPVNAGGETAPETAEVALAPASPEGDASMAEDEEPEPSEETLKEAIARLESELMEARAKADEYFDHMQRTAAEFQNTRKRQERQLQERIDRAAQGMILRLLPVLDDLELAFRNVPGSLDPEESAWVQGFAQIQQKLLGILAEEGVSPIAGEGEFDPNRHEAVTREPHDDLSSGHIIETLRTGYQYKDRVLRPALVRVAQ